MNILCHRGFWRLPEEKNTMTAFLRGFALGLGTETDIRDLDGTLVVSHDPARQGCMTFDALLAQTPRDVLLALNVKADGLTSIALDALHRAGHERYVFFDMSVPDMLSYLKAGAPVAMRLSEFDDWNDAVASRAGYVWLDAFDGTWYNRDDLDRLHATGKTILVVSDELHGRDPSRQWALLDAYAAAPQWILCTDRPEQALARFSEGSGR